MNHFTIGCKNKDTEINKKVHETHYMYESKEETLQINTIKSVYQLKNISNWSKKI